MNLRALVPAFLISTNAVFVGWVLVQSIALMQHASQQQTIDKPPAPQLSQPLAQDSSDDTGAPSVTPVLAKGPQVLALPEAGLGPPARLAPPDGLAPPDRLAPPETGPPGVRHEGILPPPDRGPYSLSIAGMPSYSGSDPCGDLESMVQALDEQLKLAGFAVSPLSASELEALLLSRTCSVDDADLQLALRPYRRLYAEANLTPPPLFSWLH